MTVVKAPSFFQSLTEAEVSQLSARCHIASSPLALRWGWRAVHLHHQQQRRPRGHRWHSVVPDWNDSRTVLDTSVGGILGVEF